MDKTRLTQRFQQALQIHGAGNPAGAEPIYREIVQSLPEFAEAWYLWGLAAQELGEHEDAAARFGRAIAIGGERDDILYHWGVSLQALGRWPSAHQCLSKALAQAPDNPHYMAGLGNLALEKKEFQHAESWYLKAIAIKESFPQVHYNLGTLYREQAENAKAFSHFQRTLELDPGHWKAHFSLGLMLQYDNRTQEAVDHYTRAIHIKPDYWRALWAMYLALPTFYQTHEEMPPARERWLAGVEKLQENFHPTDAMARREARHACESTTNFHLHYQGQNDLLAQKAQGRLLTRLAHLIYPGNSSAPVGRIGEKVHCAFVSSFLHGHSIFKTHSRFITRLDRKRFFVSVFYTGTLKDESLKMVMQGSDAFYDIGRQSERLVAAIRAAEPHVLIYTDLGMDPGLNLVSALRLAPIQCNAGGHPVTSGLPDMDYFLSSDAMEVAHAQEHYSETLVRLPNLAHCYPTPQIQRAVLPPGAERCPGEVVYCNLQNLIKLLPQHDFIYPAIALEVPGGRFWFIDPGGRIGEMFRMRLDRVFRAQGLDYGVFCRFFPRMGHYAFFGLIQASDIILDAIAWSGNNSSMESLALDKPIVTLPRELFRSRHTHGILKLLGITATQADDLGHYVAIAVRLGKDLGFRTEVVRAIAAKKSMLYEDDAPVRGLERALEAMVVERGMVVDS